MNFEQHDIEKGKAYLQALVFGMALAIGKDRLNDFVDFIANNTTFSSNNETFISTVQTYTEADIKDFEERFINKGDFDKVISKSFILEKRIQLLENLSGLDAGNATLSTDDAIRIAFKVEKRLELKQNLKNLKIEPRVILINSYFKYVGIAASFALIILAWQPQHSSNEKLFSIYSSNINSSNIVDFAGSEVLKESDGTRGEEVFFKNYGYNESSQLLEAISLVRQKEFEKAKEIFIKQNVQKDKNPGLTLYYSIAQINTNNLDSAIINLEYLIQLPDFSYKDEARYHLAFAYLKLGDRIKAKELLHTLIVNKSQFSDEAQKTLKQIRWF